MGFWDALSDFLKSDFAKNNIVQITVLQIVVIIITIFLTSLFFNKVLVPIKLRRSDYIVPEYNEALEKIKTLESENAELKKENEKYKKEKKMEKALNSDGLKEELDEGLSKFLEK
ncbi:MAG: hypothetical protein NC293_13950 [Roseburia sp.]|nr:hypothetical protein [Roseburia sp.]